MYAPISNGAPPTHAAPPSSYVALPSVLLSQTVLLLLTLILLRHYSSLIGSSSDSVPPSEAVLYLSVCQGLPQSRVFEVHSAAQLPSYQSLGLTITSQRVWNPPCPHLHANVAALRPQLQAHHWIELIFFLSTVSFTERSVAPWPLGEQL